MIIGSTYRKENLTSLKAENNTLDINVKGAITYLSCGGQGVVREKSGHEQGLLL